MGSVVNHERRETRAQEQQGMPFILLCTDSLKTWDTDRWHDVLLRAITMAEKLDGNALKTIKSVNTLLLLLL